MQFTRAVKLATCAVWLLAAGAGTAVILRYENAAGTIGETSKMWPSTSHATLAKDRATLLMFAHPRCPCTRASIGELNRLLTRCNGKIAAHVLFFQPGNSAEDWAQTDSWRSAAAIPGVNVCSDVDGNEARRFGAETSGFVVLYDAQGKLLFKGGITSGRGHAGDNAGADSIASLLNHASPGLEQTPVYGCGILSQCDFQKTNMHYASSSN